MYLLYILNVKKKKDKFEFRIRFSPNITHKLVTFSIVMHNINKKNKKKTTLINLNLHWNILII